MFRLACLLALLSFPLHAEDVALAPDPNWIDELAIPAIPEDLRSGAVAGTFDLIIDTQVSWPNGREQTWWRHVITPIDRAGLEEVGTLSYSFDPFYEDVSLTRLHVVRDGKVIDLKDSVTINVYRRELGLEDGIVDGELTAVIEVPDIRVGDVLDYAFLSDSLPVLVGSQYAISADLEMPYPVALSRFRALWPADKPIRIGPLPDRVIHQTNETGGIITHDWRIENAQPVFEPEMEPPGVWQTAWLQAGTWDSWQPISDAFAPYYQKPYDLTPEWQARIATIRQSANDPGTQAIAALRLVQDSIRYVGVEVGEGGYYARLPVDVIAKGYGDCKDKALLLKTVLAALGVEAQVVLADIDGWLSGDEVPTLFVFDHMIVRANIEGQWYYMDPTQSHQGGDLSQAVLPDYGYVLPISGDAGQGLEKIEVTLDDGWISNVTETYTFSAIGLFLTTVSEFRGAGADSWRWKWASQSHDQLEDDFLAYYADSYPEIRVTAPLSYRDDPATNTVVITENYFLSNSAKSRPETYADFVFKTDDYSDYFIEPDAERSVPLWLGMMRNQTWHIVVKDAPIWFEAPEAVTIENPAFRFGFDAWADGLGNMRLNWTYQTRLRLVDGENVPQLLEEAVSMGDYTSWTWDINPEETETE